MRQVISGLIAAVAVMAASAVPASACGGLFAGGCSPCGYVSPCAQAYVQPYSGCASGCGGYYERLPDPEVQYQSAPVALPQYYYVNQGPTYSGPGNFAPYRVYDEGGVYRPRAYRPHYYGYGGRRHYAAPYRYGYRHHPHVLRSYY